MSNKEEKGPPPAYDEDLEHINQRLQSLDLRPDRKPTVDHCIAHLKFLHALAQLRQDVSSNDSLFNITSPSAELERRFDDNENAKRRAQVREKRWQVYVTRAVERFEIWVECCVPQTHRGQPREPLKTTDLNSRNTDIAKIGLDGQPLGPVSTEKNLPPLDILMVWHAYLLNPRCFFEDCLRQSRIDFYAAYFPWKEISYNIDNKTLEYNPPSEAKEKFEHDTGLFWENLDDMADKTIRCPNCSQPVKAPWTRSSGFIANEDVFCKGSGFADDGFGQDCQRCKIRLSHDYLRVQKFRRDLQLLLKDDLPLPGTVLGTDGLPVKATSSHTDGIFAGLLAKTSLRGDLLEACKPSRSNATMDDIKKVFEVGMTLDTYIAAVKNGRRYAIGKEKLSVRKVMSRYWYNSSPFALDLVGAVTRQGSFVDKMFRIDWLHSPSLTSTMERSILKYERFFQLMRNHPTKICVPTLDVDLAWHTHQLNPQSYHAYSRHQTMKLIDHDDKIDEHDLSHAFEWTSKTYQKTYGEVYSECSCWYCESIREAHTSSADKLFSRTKNAALTTFHSNPNLPADPHLGPHISAHNVVRTSSSASTFGLHERRMDSLYNASCARARKKGYPEPRRDDYMYAYAWGYPIYYPIYTPYYVDPCISSGGVYVGDPGYVDNGQGVYGACAAGTCGGMASAGGAACAGSGAGGCGGGAAGASCGSGGGGCGGGGGGGGGCGGGGGGC
ncbi:MAG: hypothetical protein M1820_001421 [Bogoriella megaspora]|nr:MAG: hypothetical protein M1820_001421 [Bogoriella megaspora]